MAQPELTCVMDYERKSRFMIDKSAADYISGGADDEQTLVNNSVDFKKLFIRPRAMMDLSNLKLNTTILGERISFPVCVAPTGMQMLAHPEGEIASGKAAETLGTCMCMSNVSNASITELAECAPKLLKWFHVYMCKDREITRTMVKRAEEAGCKAIVFTVDNLEVGNRRSMLRNRFRVPPHFRFKNFDGLLFGDTEGSIYEMHKMFDTGLTWEGVKWLTSITRLPVVAKGILTGDDAEKALEVGCKAIYVSNHGGRQLDGVSSSIMALPEVVRAVDGRVEVYMDGGVRTGTDVLKALALGARAVFVGRPPLYGLAVGGEEGVRNVLTILRDELTLAMKLSGVSDVEKVPKSLVVHESMLCKL